MNNLFFKFAAAITFLLFCFSATAQMTSTQSENIRRIADGTLTDWEQYLNIVGGSSFESEYANLDLSIFENPQIPCLKPDFYASSNTDLDRNPLPVKEYLKASKTRLGFFKVTITNKIISPVYRNEEDNHFKVKIDFEKAVEYEKNGKKSTLPTNRQTIFFTIDQNDLNKVKIKGIRYYDATLQIRPILIQVATASDDTPTGLTTAPTLPLPDDPLKKLAVTRPTVGSVITTNRRYPITWKKTLEGPVSIELYRGPELIHTIAFDAPNRGTYTWQVPNTLRPSKEYFLRIFYPNQPNESATSGVFQVKKSFRPFKWAAITVGAGALIGVMILATNGGEKGDPQQPNTQPLPAFPDPG